MAQITHRGTGTWQVRVYLGKDSAGKRCFHTKTIHGTKRQALAYATSCEARRNKGGAFNSTISFEEFWKRYFTTCAQRNAPNTVRTRGNIYKKHLCRFADMRIDRISQLEVQDFINDLAQRGLAGTTIKVIIGTLKAAFRQAISWQILEKDPCEGVVLPRAVPNLKKIQPLTSDEIPRFMVACEQSPYGLFFRLMFVSGARSGEVRALCWDCIDLQEGTITIKRGINYNGNKLQVFTKTVASFRTIKIDDTTLSSLNDLRLKILSPLVFPGKTGRPISSNVLERELQAVLKAAGIEREHFRLYDLRHSCASYLLRSGVPIRAVSDRLGHSSAKMTLDVYDHFVGDLDQLTLKALLLIDQQIFQAKQANEAHPPTK